jgi:signal transduction histidine kinase
VVVLNILDCLAIFNINSFWGLISLVLFPYCGQHYFDFAIFTILMSFLYYLVYSVVKSQSEYIETTFKKEKQLLNRLYEADKKHKFKLQSTILRFENQRLQEKSELSQNLHDKIGHAINGSIFKLEGANLLINKDTAKSREMISDVIAALRESVDEIRYLLRNEKPSADLLNIGRLRALLSDFTDKYDIETSLVVEGDAGRVPIDIYGILYDNTIEALSNSLKYARCSKISATLGIYHRIVRYNIHDNGAGAQNIEYNMGLAGIRERIISAGGTVSICGEDGFEVNMLIPISDSEQGADVHG